MNRLFNTLIGSIRAKFTPILTKARMLTNPAYLKTRVFSKVRQFFTKLFDVRPKNKRDYYGVWRWLVSKKLAFALAVILAVVCLFYIYSVLPASFLDRFSAAQGVRTYKYNSLALKYYSGTVRILAADKHLGYVGEVSDGAVNGQGVLYDAAGAVVYEGAFSGSRYNGAGTLYYPDGTVRYTGAFTDNEFNGAGKHYRASGTLEYDGEHVMGARTGHGTLYNAGGNGVYTGTFQQGAIVFGELLGKTTGEVGQMYTGRAGIYTAGDESCVQMKEVGAVYALASGAGTIDQEYRVSSVLVLSDTFTVGTRTIGSVNELTRYFGAPDYLGVSRATLAEAVAINLLAETNDRVFGTVEMTAQSALEDVYTVSGYDRGFEVYIYAYESDGLLYTFYAPSGGSDSFAMYAIESAE